MSGNKSIQSTSWYQMASLFLNWYPTSPCKLNKNRKYLSVSCHKANFPILALQYQYSKMLSMNRCRVFLLKWQASNVYIPKQSKYQVAHKINKNKIYSCPYHLTLHRFFQNFLQKKYIPAYWYLILSMYTRIHFHVIHTSKFKLTPITCWKVYTKSILSKTSGNY